MRNLMVLILSVMVSGLIVGLGLEFLLQLEIVSTAISLIVVVVPVCGLIRSKYKRVKTIRECMALIGNFIELKTIEKISLLLVLGIGVSLAIQSIVSFILLVLTKVIATLVLTVIAWESVRKFAEIKDVKMITFAEAVKLAY